MAKKKKVRKKDGDGWLIADFVLSVGELFLYVPRLVIGLFRNIP